MKNLDLKNFEQVKISNRQIFDVIILTLLVLQLVVNLIGALGPELAFDALWYHLTLPKLYLQNHVSSFISGGLLYYSSMPKLTEMLYIGALAFGYEQLPELIHFSFGVLCLIVLYKLSRQFVTSFFALLIVLIFSSNLVFAWEMTTAYIDLARTFFEITALYGLLLFVKTQKKVYLWWTAIMVGLATTSKLLAIGSGIILFILLTYDMFRNTYSKSVSLRDCFITLSSFFCIALCIVLPWLIFSYHHTGSPFYPFFSPVYPIHSETISIPDFFRALWFIFIRASDPISPVYVMVIPLGIYLILKKAFSHYFLAAGTLDATCSETSQTGKNTVSTYAEQVSITTKKKLKQSYLYIFLYSLLSLVFWYITPRTGGGRFLLPYLPVYSLLVGIIISRSSKIYQKTMIIVILLIAIVTIAYRGVANLKFVPVILGLEPKAQFLSEHLNFSYGDFYDIDGFFRKTIKPSDRVLLYGFHNLYYVDFPFVHESWLKKSDYYNYIAVQHGGLPEKYNNWILVYENKTTGVKLYKK